MATAHWIGCQRKNHALAASRILKSIPFPRILQPVSRRTHLRSSAMNSPGGRAKLQALTMQGLIQSARNGSVRAQTFLAERVCGLKESLTIGGEVNTNTVQ